ncbi:MAG: hypothetical protein AAF658_07750, partial [Myxococcota bacterium]
LEANGNGGGAQMLREVASDVDAIGPQGSAATARFADGMRGENPIAARTFDDLGRQLDEAAPQPARPVETAEPAPARPVDAPEPAPVRPADVPEPAPVRQADVPEPPPGVGTRALREYPDSIRPDVTEARRAVSRATGPRSAEDIAQMRAESGSQLDSLAELERLGASRTQFLSRRIDTLRQGGVAGADDAIAELQHALNVIDSRITSLVQRAVSDIDGLADFSVIGTRRLDDVVRRLPTWAGRRITGAEGRMLARQLRAVDLANELRVIQRVGTDIASSAGDDVVRQLDAAMERAIASLGRELDSVIQAGQASGTRGGLVRVVSALDEIADPAFGAPPTVASRARDLAARARQRVPGLATDLRNLAGFNRSLGSGIEQVTTVLDGVAAGTARSSDAWDALLPLYRQVDGNRGSGVRRFLADRPMIPVVSRHFRMPFVMNRFYGRLRQVETALAQSVRQMSPEQFAELVDLMRRNADFGEPVRRAVNARIIDIRNGVAVNPFGELPPLVRRRITPRMTRAVRDGVAVESLFWIAASPLGLQERVGRSMTGSEIDFIDDLGYTLRDNPYEGYTSAYLFRAGQAKLEDMFGH